MENGHCVLLGNFVTKYVLVHLNTQIFQNSQYVQVYLVLISALVWNNPIFKSSKNNLKNLQPLTDYIYLPENLWTIFDSWLLWESYRTQNLLKSYSKVQLNALFLLKCTYFLHTKWETRKSSTHHKWRNQLLQLVNNSGQENWCKAMMYTITYLITFT